MTEETEELPSSKLGTKEYWDSAYNHELSNYKRNGDIGDVWFGEESIERVVTWMLESALVNVQSSVVDLGCGNGAFLLYLNAEGFTNLTGIDYSQEAIELARTIAAEKKVNIKYEQVDLINDEDKEKIKTSEFDVTHDKGTYDAVSLCPEDPKSKRLSYIKAVHRITKENGLFIITSCNWVHHELIEHFSEYFSKEHIIPTPTFKFGGKVGTQVTCIVFRKVSK
ncbi:EEF1A lysine methyltransferase 2-like [Homarus americanus]|uniref:EEF1A lysine methyltransferase 2-like n=1 Tax=Homarus americanus TaxID=6706 RepID=UPI001C46ABBF|nr:EEF1A lysine methyltransferase 2-like [Homarus americanus]